MHRMHDTRHVDGDVTKYSYVIIIVPKELGSHYLFYPHTKYTIIPD